MKSNVLDPQDVQPLAAGELQAEPPHDVSVPEPTGGAREAAQANGPSMQGACEGEMAGDLLKVKRWAEEVGGPERLKELCDVLLRLRA